VSVFDDSVHAVPVARMEREGMDFADLNVGCGDEWWSSPVWRAQRGVLQTPR
jgi:hypothetical protein